MRRRSFAVGCCSLVLALSAPVGNASLEDDCYVAGGYFDATYFGSGYIDETCTPAEAPSPVSSDNKHRSFFRFPGTWR